MCAIQLSIMNSTLIDLYVYVYYIIAVHAEKNLGENMSVSMTASASAYGVWLVLLNKKKQTKNTSQPAIFSFIATLCYCYV